MKSASLMVVLYGAQPAQHYEMASNLYIVSGSFLFSVVTERDFFFFFWQTSFWFLRDFTSVQFSNPVG